METPTLLLCSTVENWCAQAVAFWEAQQHPRMVKCFYLGWPKRRSTAFDCRMMERQALRPACHLRQRQLWQTMVPSRRCRCRFRMDWSPVTLWSSSASILSMRTRLPDSCIHVCPCGILFDAVNIAIAAHTGGGATYFRIQDAFHHTVEATSVQDSNNRGGSIYFDPPLPAGVTTASCSSMLYMFRALRLSPSRPGLGLGWNIRPAGIFILRVRSKIFHRQCL